MGSERTIALMILSHSDGDHLGEAAEIIAEFDVEHIIWTGFYRNKKFWRETRDAIEAEEQNGATVHNLTDAPLIPGTTIQLGDATLTLIAGWPEWPGTIPTDAAERRNVISIVARLEYGGNSILYTGDTIGRAKGDDDDVCESAELFMVLNSSAVSVASEVIIAPHHGGDNGSSSCFVEAVDPTYVIFSSGSDHDHPSWGAARRYLSWGVPIDNIFRTDWGDDESDEGDYEWRHGRVIDCQDGRGDEDVEVVLPQTGNVQVGYRSAATGC
jgi:beta-lactamase superfamily II metal-dependent hydrolase